MMFTVLLSLMCISTLDGFHHNPEDVNCGSGLEGHCKCQLVPELVVSCNNLGESFMFPSEIANQSLVYDLDLSGNNIGMLYYVQFNSLIIINLDLSNNKLNSDGISSLMSYNHNCQRYLSGLDLSNNEFTSIPTTIVNLMALESLDLRGNNLDYIPFGHLPMIPHNLKRIHLSKVAFLPFKSDPENQISLLEMRPQTSKSLADMMFPEYTVTLGLSGNLDNLQTLVVYSGHYLFNPNDVIPYLPSLEHLEIKDCDLGDDQINRRLSNQNGNSILTLLSLVNVSLEFVPMQLLSTLDSLQSLDLSHNKIYYLNSLSFWRNNNLEYIDLSYNKLNLIEGGTFGFQNQLFELNLSHNSLTLIKKYMFTKNIQDMILLAGENLWICDCDNWWFMSLVYEQYEGQPGPLDQYEISNSLTCCETTTGRQMLVYEAYIYLRDEASVSC